MAIAAKADRKRVFVSYSHADVTFARRLVRDLSVSGVVGVWFDEHEIQIGATISKAIDAGLKDASYLLQLLSPDSVRSDWVKLEFHAARALRIPVLPMLIRRLELPHFLRDTLYLDASANYTSARNSLIEYLKQEDQTGITLRTAAASGPPDECPTRLSRLTLAELRRRICAALSLAEIGIVWFDTFSSTMSNDFPGRGAEESAVELIDRSKRRSKLDELYENLCAAYPHVKP